MFHKASHVIVPKDSVDLYVHVTMLLVSGVKPKAANLSGDLQSATTLGSITTSETYRHVLCCNVLTHDYSF